MKEQNKLLAYLVAGIVITLIAGLPVAYAGVEQVYTTAHFNVPSALAFTVTLYGEAAVESTGGGAATTDIEFNCTATSGSQNNVNASVVGGSTQDSGNAIMAIDNTGTVNLNLTIYINESLPACMTLEGGRTLPLSQDITTSEYAVIYDYTPANASLDWFMQTDFVACTSVDSALRVIYINGTET